MTAPCATIVDYGVGNIASIVKMLQKAGAHVQLTDDPGVVLAAERLILPGVGAFDSCASALRSKEGLIEAITEKVAGLGCPLLGICVGMQLLVSNSEEGECAGLGLIEGTARRFDFGEIPSRAALRVPHMNWAPVEFAPASRLFSSDQLHRRFYFVHSYHVVCANIDHVSAWATYGYRFAAAVERGNIFGVQFHPEKSHRFGLELFRRFLQIGQP